MVHAVVRIYTLMKIRYMVYTCRTIQLSCNTVVFIRVRQCCCVVDAIQLVAAKLYQQSYTLMLVSASSTQIPNAPTAVGLDNITPVRSVSF